jgi:hypothetical protein
MDDLMDRKQDELDRLTVAVANGYAISMSAEAHAKWTAAHTPMPEHSPEAIAQQAMTLAQIGRWFPGAVKKVKAN